MASIKGTVGFVPTMGALHAGHLSLVKQSLDTCNYTVVSIFVNPKQFSPNEDFDSYPRDLNKDRLVLDSLKVDVLFLPDETTIYPKHFSTHVEEKRLSMTLEGLSRPHFFKGVLTGVLKLFNIISPQNVFFGKKDFFFHKSINYTKHLTLYSFV